MPERPRVLQMGPDPSNRGGMSTALTSLLESPLADAYELEMLPTYRSAKPLPRLGRFLLSLLQLTLWSLRGRGRIVHVHMTVRASTYRKAVVVLWAKALGRRVVLHSHSGAKEVAHYRGRMRPAPLALVRRGIKAADRVIAVSEAGAAALAEAYGVAEVEVVPNAAPSVAPFERPPTPPEGPLLAYLGGFANPAKGADTLLDALEIALARVPGLRLTMAGPPEPPPRALELVAANPGLSWAGWLEPEQKDELMRTAEAFVMPSHSEGLPMALLEAMAYRMAAVATRVGGIPEVVDDGFDGLLVPAEDAPALADAIVALATDAELRERLAAAARDRAERLDDVEVAGRLGRIYESLLRG
jgi:glycosyltransferase involved in cell wall biosynthesis